MDFRNVISTPFRHIYDDFLSSFKIPSFDKHLKAQSSKFFKNGASSVHASFIAAQDPPVNDVQ